MASQNKAKKEEPQSIRFLAGGLSSCTAEILTLPIDMAKVRLFSILSLHHVDVYPVSVSENDTIGLS